MKLANTYIPEQFEGEIGVFIIDPEKHYTLNQRSIAEIKEYILRRYGIDATPELIDALVYAEDEEYNPDHIFINNELNSGQLHANAVADYATDANSYGELFW